MTQNSLRIGDARQFDSVLSYQKFNVAADSAGFCPQFVKLTCDGSIPSGHPIDGIRSSTVEPQLVELIVASSILVGCPNFDVV